MRREISDIFNNNLGAIYRQDPKEIAVTESFWYR